MSAEVTLFTNFAILECQDGPHWVAWGQLGASLLERRCWLFLWLARHSKGNAGVSEFACWFCGFLDISAHWRSSHQQGTQAREEGCLYLHLALQNLPAWPLSAWREGCCWAAGQTCVPRQTWWVVEGASGVAHTALYSFSPFSLHLSCPLCLVNIHLGFPFYVPVTDLFAIIKKISKCRWSVWYLDSAEIKSRNLG